MHALNDLLPWVALAVLGAYHGVNPGMGWLFAVALGLQEKSRKAVLQALIPIALGHEASIALAVVIVSLLEAVAAPRILHLVGAATLIGFGIYKLLKPRSHPRWVGMRVSRLDLVVWSFIMSSAHGAGLMLFPVLLGLSNGTAGDVGDVPTIDLSSAATIVTDVGAILVHTMSMLLVMGIVALVVYERLGLRVLRQAWVNLDTLWAGAVLGAGLVTLFT